MRLMIEGEWFLDAAGRRVLLRGVSLSGSSKLPKVPDVAAYVTDGFSNHRDVSFVDRPFPIEEAAEHFGRISHWGFNCIRFLVTWEAIEHSGPDQYDRQYLDYLEEVLKVAGEYDLYVIIDPHQDVWSRMTGGDGAPGWTFEKVGLDINRLSVTGAAHLPACDSQDASAQNPMGWGQNRIRFATATMWTLFFGGARYAPSCMIDGLSSQEYLQDHYCNAFRQVADRVHDMEHVIGFEPMNEPDSAWIGTKVDGSNMDVSSFLGHVFTPFDAMVTASGFSRVIPYREVKRFRIKETRKDRINPDGVSVWMPGHDDVWRRDGVWDTNAAGEPTILRNDHFMVSDGQPVDFCRDSLSPFMHRFARTIRISMPEAVLFFELPYELLMKGRDLQVSPPPDSVHASHWYDVATIGTKRFMGKASYDMMKDTTVIGSGNVQKMFVQQLAWIKEVSRRLVGESPTVIGEFGLCYDLDGKKAYDLARAESKTAWKTHIRALSMYYSALDANLLHAIQWNYTPDNTNGAGDGWNLEDLSIFSRDQQYDPTDIDSGGRAIEGFCRPHFVRISGIPLKSEFNLKEGVYTLEFEADAAGGAPSEIYVPRVQFPSGLRVELSEGTVECPEDCQLVRFRCTRHGPHTVKISQGSAVSREWAADDDEEPKQEEA